MKMRSRAAAWFATRRRLHEHLEGRRPPQLLAQEGAQHALELGEREGLSDGDSDGDEAMPGTPPKPSGGAVPASQAVGWIPPP